MKDSARHSIGCQKATEKLPIQAELSLKFPYLWKSFSDTMGLQTEDGWSNVTKDLWVTVQAAGCLVNQKFGKLLTMYFLFTQVILYSTGIFDEVEEQIVIDIVFLGQDKR